MADRRTRSCRGEWPRRRIRWSDLLTVRRTTIDTEWPAQEGSAESAEDDVSPLSSVLDGPRFTDNRTKPLVAKGPGKLIIILPAR